MCSSVQGTFRLASANGRCRHPFLHKNGTRDRTSRRRRSRGTEVLVPYAFWDILEPFWRPVFRWTNSVFLAGRSFQETAWVCVWASVFLIGASKASELEVLLQSRSSQKQHFGRKTNQVQNSTWALCIGQDRSRAHFPGVMNLGGCWLRDRFLVVQI